MSKIPRNSAALRVSACLIAGSAAVFAVGGWTSLSVSAPASAAAYQAEPIAMGDIYNAPNSADDEDRVGVVFTRIPQVNQVKFVLHSAPRVTWWKQIRLVDKAGETLAGQEDFTQDDKHHTRVLTIGRKAVEQGAFIVFAKAKVFGRHTDMYRVQIPLAHLGHRIDITWQDD